MDRVTGLGETGKLIGREQLLKLMVAQLQHQNPLAPVSSQEFFGQLTQLLMVESLENLRSQMERLTPQLSPQASALATLVNLVGRTVEVDAPGGPLQLRVDGLQWSEGTWFLVSNGRKLDPALVTGLAE